MITQHYDLSDDYRAQITKMLGDAAPQYIAMLEKLLEVSDTLKPETQEAVYKKMALVSEEIKQYAAQFGFLFFALILVDESGGQKLRIGLVDKTLGQLSQ